MPSKDPAVHKRARDKWYYANKDQQIQRQMDRRRELIDWLWDYKRTLRCTDCDTSFEEHPEWVDFHHLDPEKKEGTAGETIRSSKKKLMAELAKCVPLCSNCHRTRHASLYHTTVA